MRLLLSIALLCASALPARAALTTSYFRNVDVATNITTHGSLTLGGDTRSTWPAAILDYTAVTVPIGGDVTPSFTNIIATNLAIGSHDLWTVPAGFIAYVGTGMFYNSTNTSITPSLFVQTNGVYYRLGANNSGVTTNSATFLSTHGGRWLLPGDLLNVTNGAGGLSLYGTFKLYPTNTALKIVRLPGFTNTAVKLYEVPVGKIAVPLSSNNSVPSLAGFVAFTTDPAVSTFFSLYVVPPGGSVDNSTLVASTAQSSGSTSASLPVMPAGTSVWVKSSATTAGQLVAVTIYELTPP